MRHVAFVLAAALPLAALMPAHAADPAPEIKRETAAPQAIGAAHTLRVIPEACARLEGTFTGDAAQPYKFVVAQTNPACQARARFVDVATAKPSEATGWVFNDLIRVPKASCATEQAVVRVWRRPAHAVPPKLDAQGRSRIYLEESVAKAKARTLTPIPMYTAAMSLEGLPCK